MPVQNKLQLELCNLARQQDHKDLNFEINQSVSKQTYKTLNSPKCYYDLYMSKTI